METYHRLVVPAAAAGMRLDKFLASQLEIGRDRIKALLEQGLIRVEGRAAKASLLLAAGMVVEAAVPPRPVLSLSAQDIPLEILYEDDQLLVINKASGMVVHPAPGNPDRTLVNALLHRCRQLSQLGGEWRPGIVHRLDKETSGVILAAKNDLAHRRLAEQFKNREVEKLYLALVIGTLPAKEGAIARPIGRDPRQRQKISSRSRRAKEALTQWRELEKIGPLTWLEVRLGTGRTHQIRVHLSEQGNPLAGDALYGGRRRPPQPYARVIQQFGRLALHAWRLRFRHPQDGRMLQLEAPLPAAFEMLLRRLRSLAGGEPRD